MFPTAENISTVPLILTQRVSPHRVPLLRSEWVPCSLMETNYVFVNTSADHNPSLSPVVLHGVDLNFDSRTFQVIRNFDFQYWANPCVPWNPSFRLASFITSGRHILDMSQRIKVLPIHCHELSRNIVQEKPSHKTNVIASFTRSSAFWKAFELSLCCCTEFPWAGTLIKSDFVKIDTPVGATLESDSSFTLATAFHVLDEEWS